MCRETLCQTSPALAIVHHILHGNRAAAWEGICLAIAQQLRPILGGRLSQNLLKHTVEMRQRLEPDLEGNLAYPQVWIEQPVFGCLYARARKVIREVTPGPFLEHLAKIKSGGFGRLGAVPEPQAL